MYEAEIKYALEGPFAAPGRPLPDAVYHDAYFDSPDGAFYASGRELRLRETGGQTMLTYKNPPFDTATHSKEELETAVADGPAMREILLGLGYVVRLAFAKHCRRSLDVHHGLALAVTVVTVDFSPLTFVEIEHLDTSRKRGLAALPVIRAYAAALGLTRECPNPYTELCLAARRAAAPGPSPRGHS